MLLSISSLLLLLPLLASVRANFTLPREGSIPRTLSIRGSPTLCLDVTSGPAAPGPGNTVEIWECNGHTNQLWLFDDGSWKIQYAADPSMCLDAGDMQAGTQLQLWGCNGMAQQKFGFDPTTSAIYIADGSVDGKHPNADLCVDAADMQLGSVAQIWGCNSLPQQQWSVLWGTTIRANQDYTYCLDLAGGDPSPGTAVQMWGCNGLPNQQWIYFPSTGVIMYGGGSLDNPVCLDAHDVTAGSSFLFVWSCDDTLPQQQWGYDNQMQTLYLRMSASGGASDASLCMDIYGGALGEGAQMESYECNGCWNQQFTLGGGVTASLERAVYRGSSSPAGPTNDCPPLPGPQPGPQPAGKCVGGWPEFASAAALRADPWGKYFQTVYGDVPTDNAYPLCLGDFWQYYTAEITNAGVTNIPASAGTCPSKKTAEADYYTTFINSKSYPPPAGLNWVWHAPPYQAFADNTWVEVIHCGGVSDEHTGAWFYYAKGSGVWFNLGKTIAFTDHGDAFSHFRVNSNEKMCSAAASAGYDSIQFRAHPCGNCKSVSKTMNYELVSTKLIGYYACCSKDGRSDLIRSGWMGANACNCDNSKKHLNCAGVPELSYNGSRI